MKLTPRTEQVHLRLSPDLKKAAEAAAAAQRRSLTSLIEGLLLDHLASTESKKSEGKRR
jgi:predicted HicB family RNase H-like nuclease